jgi:hypothetical protein
LIVEGVWCRRGDEEWYKNSSLLPPGLDGTTTNTTLLCLLNSISSANSPHITSMKILASVLVMTVIASAAATPIKERQTASSLCGPLDTPQCCGTDVLGLADLGCSASMMRTLRLQVSPMLMIVLQSQTLSRRLQVSHPTVLPRARLPVAACSHWCVCRQMLILLILTLLRSLILPVLYALVSPERTYITALAVNDTFCISVVSLIISLYHQSLILCSIVLPGSRLFCHYHLSWQSHPRLHASGAACHIRLS